MQHLNSLEHYVPKPWGKEYLCWRSKSCAIWLLELHHGASTSFHCHTKKNTGLVVLEGLVRLRLINSEYELGPLEKINIFRGRFHSSFCLGEKGSVMIEVEAPVDKSDLVRWEDSYGRENLGYETEAKLFDSSEERVLIDYQKGKVSRSLFCTTEFLVFDERELKQNIEEDCLFICLEGGIGPSEKKLVVVPGDVFSTAVLLKLLDKFDIVSGSILLRLRKVL